ncbi:hypothetical protein B0H16DRAFT_1599916 [Mycena metata]|uniref:Class E vacuolar protein-sorting machinery protein HSE1 n=1 Tax=Mycena metata TaxID=1033252 RepID=A0AAD7MLV6_9AGAR|nr:hypothetical protein B0H16DRAFT_1599916 [Mycena metata]
MFGGATSNPYDDIVVKTTSETLTSENWELILNLCDKVSDEGQEGSHNVVAALLKRLTHRNPNVQLYTLSLAEALGKNCGVELHRELASRAWTQGLERVITDRNTHEKVRTRALGLVALWTSDFSADPSLGLMGECYEGLKAKNYKYTRPDTPPPPAVDDAIRRQEEEELQRVLEMSVRDRGGRQPYSGYDEGTGAGGSSSAAAAASNNNDAYRGGGASGGGSGGGMGGSASAAGASGYAPAAAQERTPSPTASLSNATAPNGGGVGTGAAGAAGFAEGAIITRVRALHPFTPTEAGELGFEKGDVIKVVDRGYRDWWRGQLRGRTGIFPVNYVEPLPEPTPAELAAEASQEAAVFAQAVNVERLLNMLRALDPSRGDNLADDEEIQELYRSCMALRPKIVKLIDKYSQKRADLVSMNETFVRARTIFDRMMEESLARHSGGVYVGGPQPAGPGGYPQQQQPYYGGYPDAAAYQYAQQQQQAQAQQGPGQPPAQGQAGYGVYGPTGPTPYPAQGQQPGASAYPAQGQQQGPTPYPAQGQQGPSASGYPAQQQGQQGPTPYPAQQQQQPAQQQAQAAQQQPVQQQQPAAQQAQPEPAAAAQSQAQPQAAQTGPPYVYDPNTTYADPNVQAWAQYYAAGGKDLAGSVYFVSIPGITEAPAAGAGGQAGQQQQQEREREQQAAAAAAAQQQQQQAAAAAAQQQAQAQQQAIQQQQLQAQQAQQAQLQAQQQQQAVAQQQQQQQPYESPTSPIDDDPGYFPDPYANQPEGAYTTPALQPDYSTPHRVPTQQTPGELAHALGPQPGGSQQQPQAGGSQYQGYSLTDPGSGSAGAQQPVLQRGYSLTDPGVGSAAAAAQPASPVVGTYAAGVSGALGGGPGGSPVAEPAGTPSWVLPKKVQTPGGRGAGSPQPGQAAGLSGQFAGMHV